MKRLLILFLLISSTCFSEEMIRKEYSKFCNTDLIMEEILTVHSDWGGTKNSEGVYCDPKLLVESRRDLSKLWLTFPKSSEKEIDEIVSKHDASKLSTFQRRSLDEETKRMLVDAKVRDLAEKELIKEGKLDANGKVK